MIKTIIPQLTNHIFWGIIMRKILLRQVAIALLASTALLVPTAFAADYTVSTPTTVTNGDAVNVLNGDDSLTITSAGSISTSTGGVRGVAAVGDNNTINNFGSISTTGIATEGVFVVNNSFINNFGSISTTDIDSFGIFGFDNNVLNNSGSISTTSNGSFGIQLQDGNTITNSGTISTGGDGALGIVVIDANNITNTGSINTGGDNAIAIWLNSRGNVLTNSGVIKTTGPGAAGIYVGGIENTITNSGEIYALGANANAFETSASSNGTTFTNSGKLITIEGSAIKFGATDSILNLLAPSFIGGKMDFATTEVNITTGRSHSVLWDFSNGSPTMNFGGEVPWAWNAATSKFATIDPTALSAAPDMVAGLTAGVSELVRNNSVGGEYWLKTFGSYSQTGASGIYNDYYNYGGGIVGGVSAQINKDFYAGVTLGYGVSNLTVNSRWETSQTVNSKGVLGGFYAKSQIDNFYADFALIGGLMGNDSSRLVNDNLANLGIDYANATYNSWFLAPELRIGVDIAGGSDWTLTPSAMIRYTSQATDGYTETGSNANVTISARTTQLLEGNLELAASKPLENGTLTLAGGLDYRQTLGAATQNVTLLGQNLAIPLNNEVQYVAYASATASFGIGNNMNFDMNAKAAFGANGYKSISGTLGISGKF